jgi:hypothetical protein
MSCQKSFLSAFKNENMEVRGGSGIDVTELLQLGEIRSIRLNQHTNAK